MGTLSWLVILAVGHVLHAQNRECTRINKKVGSCYPALDPKRISAGGKDFLQTNVVYLLTIVEHKANVGNARGSVCDTDHRLQQWKGNACRFAGVLKG